MTSIHTNIGAMTSLSALRSIAASLFNAQENASSGLRIGKASDNAAYWSIATTMRSDIGSLTAASDAINLSKSVVDTAYNGLNTIIDLVGTMRSKFILGIDADYSTRLKLQAEVLTLQDAYAGVAASSTFAGENWLYRSSTTQSNTTSLVTGVARASDGSFQVQSESVDLTKIMLIDIGPNNPTLGLLTMAYNDNGGGTFTYTRHGYVKNNGLGTVNMNFAIGANVKTVRETMLAEVSMIDSMLKNITDAATTVGAIRGNIDRQQSFVTQMMNTGRKSIGRLVDADMNETATRLRAMETRQKLAAQGLSIANARPSMLQKLFS